VKILIKIGNVVITVLILLILLVSVVIAIISLNNKSEGLPHLFGYAILSVQTESMSPALEPGDLIIAKKLDEDTPLGEGDIVTFPWEEQDIVTTKTHRIVRVEEADGDARFYTKGDNPATNPLEDDGYLLRSDILAKYADRRYPGWGKIMDVLRSRKGFALAVLLPMGLFFLYELIRFISNLMAFNREKALELAKAEQEKALELAEAEFERRLAAQRGGAPPEAPPENAPTGPLPLVPPSMRDAQVNRDAPTGLLPFAPPETPPPMRDAQVNWDAPPGE